MGTVRILGGKISSFGLIYQVFGPSFTYTLFDSLSSHSLTLVTGLIWNFLPSLILQQ